MQPDDLAAQLAAAQRERDEYKTLLSLLTPSLPELQHRLHLAAHEWWLVRQDDSPLPGMWRRPEHADI